MGASLKIAVTVSQAKPFCLDYFKAFTKSFGGYLQLNILFLASPPPPPQDIFLFNISDVQHTELVFHIFFF